MGHLSLESAQWSSLKHIGEVSPLDESDVAALDAIKEILREHRKLARFGVFLLHRHFEIGDDEMVLEQTDAAARISTSRVVLRRDVAADSVETTWRFKDDDSRSGTVCMARCVPEQGH